MPAKTTVLCAAKTTVLCAAKTTVLFLFSAGTTALNLRFSCLGEHAHNVTFNVSAQMLVLQIVNLRLELDVLNKEMPELYPGRCVNEVCVKRCVESYASHACSLKVNLQCSSK